MVLGHATRVVEYDDAGHAAGGGWSGQVGRHLAALHWDEDVGQRGYLLLYPSAFLILLPGTTIRAETETYFSRGANLRATLTQDALTRGYAASNRRKVSHVQVHYVH